MRRTPRTDALMSKLADEVARNNGRRVPMQEPLEQAIDHAADLERESDSRLEYAERIAPLLHVAAVHLKRGNERLLAEIIEALDDAPFDLAAILEKRSEMFHENPNPSGHLTSEASLPSSGEASGPVGLGPFTPMPAIDEEGWTEWVHPLPGYLMKCCDCGLVHELDARIVHNKEVRPDGSWDADWFKAPGHEVVFRMRRSPTVHQMSAEPAAWIEHHKGGDNLTWDRIDHPNAKATPLYRAVNVMRNEP